MIRSYFTHGDENVLKYTKTSGNIIYNLIKGHRFACLY